MTPQAFVAKWGPGGPGYGLNERQGAQQHFIELCALLGVASPTGSNDGDSDYLFEKGTLALGRQRGFADVFKRGAFAWEYKAPGRPLDAALSQLMRYALALDNPPLLIVSDRLRVEIHTHFNGTPSERHVVDLHELGDPAKRELLRRAFEAPDSFRPKRTNRQITEEAAHAFATTAERLREAGLAPEAVSHFLNQCLFCFFAEDVGLLPSRLFEKLVGVRTEPDKLRTGLQQLFTTMQGGGLFGADDIPWFNGGLFKTIAVPPLTDMDVTALRDAAALDWSAIDPSIFGTLFERGLDPAKRSQLGAHYTDPATIERLIDPVIRRPLRAEWDAAKPRIAAKLAKSKRADDKAWRDARAEFVAYLERLRAYRVLDPACGSGNFLYLALKCLKDLEHQANLEAEALGLQREVDSYTSPANVLGIELNEYAAELARVTVWIGELQWRLQQGYPFKLNPVLEPLDHIDCRDALLQIDDGGLKDAGALIDVATWPRADVVIGNPPFLGDKKMRSELGEEYTIHLRLAYEGKVPGGADLVCYWFEKARAQIEAGALQRAGLVATNSIRQSANREVLAAVAKTTRIFEAWADEPWVNDGAAVRVSLVAFGESLQASMLDGTAVTAIYADLKAQASGAAAMDLTGAQPLPENAEASFFGFCLAGPFTVEPAVARDWLLLGGNPHGKPNSDVLVPLWNGADVTRRFADRWAIDFGATTSEADAALYERPFEHALKFVKPDRVGNNRASRAKNWWRHGETRPGLRKQLANVPRMIVTAERAKHRYFVWLPVSAAPEHRLVVFPRSDDTSFGLLSCRFHVSWALACGSTLEDRPGYNTTVCFLPFPFPKGLTPADTAHQRTEALDGGALIPAGTSTGSVRTAAEAIARAAHALNALRERWLNPPEWTERVPEVVPLGYVRSDDRQWYVPAPAAAAGFEPAATPARDALRSPQAGPLSRARRAYPDRIVAKPGFEKQLAQRTLTKLYNERPAWLAQAHERLDAAVAAAYGWADYTPALPDEEILRRLLALNRERAAG